MMERCIRTINGESSDDNFARLFANLAVAIVSKEVVDALPPTIAEQALLGLRVTIISSMSHQLALMGTRDIVSWWQNKRR